MIFKCQNLLKNNLGITLLKNTFNLQSLSFAETKEIKPESNIDQSVSYMMNFLHCRMKYHLFI